MSDPRHPPHPILVVDDEEGILLSIDTTLRMGGIDNILTCADPRRVGDLLAGRPVEVLLLDLNMPHVDGESLLAMAAREHPDTPVIIVTGAGDVETAVRCIKAGAFDYVVKPVEADRLLAAVNRALSFRELTRENLALKHHMLSDTLDRPEAFSGIVTRNKKMVTLFQYIESIAPTSQPVLIQGETGVGKELVARSVHAVSGREGGFVAVNVAGLDDNIFSDTLFGHVRGAFTGADQDRSGLLATAAGGTLFLDEIGDLSPASQVKLLRLLQEREYFPVGADRARRTDARIIAATNQSLESLQAEGRFRKDLHYRLLTHRIHIPPLRDRPDDIEPLAEHFLRKAARALDRPPPTPPPELFPLLRSCPFPGNVRELESMIFDAVSRHRSGVLSLEVFKAHLVREGTVDPPAPNPESEDGITFPPRLPTIKQATERLVAEALRRTGGNQTLAARLLGISQQALSKRLKKRAEGASR